MPDYSLEEIHEQSEPLAVSTTQLGPGVYVVIFFCPFTGYKYFRHGTQFKFEIGDVIPETFYSLSLPLK